MCIFFSGEIRSSKQTTSMIQTRESEQVLCSKFWTFSLEEFLSKWENQVLRWSRCQRIIFTEKSKVLHILKEGKLCKRVGVGWSGSNYKLPNIMNLNWCYLNNPIHAFASLGDTCGIVSGIIWFRKCNLRPLSCKICLLDHLPPNKIFFYPSNALKLWSIY